MLIAYFLFLIPLDSEATLLNTIWFGVILCIFYTSYTLTMLTYYATFSEVTENERDALFLSNTKSICDVVYFSLGFALIPLFVSLGINVRVVAIIFAPLCLSMIIPFLLLDEKNEGDELEVRSLTLPTALKTSFQNKAFIIWLGTISIMTVGLQLFLGGINELFSSTGLNMTLVMASSFAPVPLTIMVYNKITKKYGLGIGYKYVLTVFTLGMIIMYFCNINSDKLSNLWLTLIAILGGIFVSFAIGALFSITYTVPTNLAREEAERSGKTVSTMYFAVQGLFEGIASGIATGFILVTLKSHDIISILPIIVAACCAIAFGLSFIFPKSIKDFGRGVDMKKTEDKIEETV